MSPSSKIILLIVLLVGAGAAAFYLHRFYNKNTIIPAPPFETSAITADRTGHYQLLDLNSLDLADTNQYIDIAVLEKDAGKLQGHAEWIGVTPGAIHFGDIGAIVSAKETTPPDRDYAVIRGNQIFYYGGSTGCMVIITFQEQNMLEAQDNEKCGGVNVRFTGKYRKTTSTISDWSRFEFIQEEP